MAADSPRPLATVGDMTNGAFADLVKAFPNDALERIMVEATRACETETTRRLAPFTATIETHRAEGVDPDEYASINSGIPLDLQGSLGMSYANALGFGGVLVRRVWLREYAPYFPELWTYSNVTISITPSIGGGQVANPMVPPRPDTGEVWFDLGTFCPIGSQIRCTYSGGYTTTPADLARACKLMAASIACRELDPQLANHGHDPSALEAEAVRWLAPYHRGTP